MPKYGTLQSTSGTIICHRQHEAPEENKVGALTFLQQLEGTLMSQQQSDVYAFAIEALPRGEGAESGAGTRLQTAADGFLNAYEP